MKELVKPEDQYFALLRGEKIRNSEVTEIQPIHRLKQDGQLLGQHMFIILPNGVITYDMELWMPSRTKK